MREKAASVFLSPFSPSMQEVGFMPRVGLCLAASQRR